MTVFAVLWLVSFGAMWSILLGSPEHKVSGYPAALIFMGMFVSGTVLSVHALG